MFFPFSLSIVFLVVLYRPSCPAPSPSSGTSRRNVWNRTEQERGQKFKKTRLRHEGNEEGRYSGCALDVTEASLPFVKLPIGLSILTVGVAEASKPKDTDFHDRGVDGEEGGRETATGNDVTLTAQIQ